MIYFFVQYIQNIDISAGSQPNKPSVYFTFIAHLNWDTKCSVVKVKYSPTKTIRLYLRKKYFAPFSFLNLNLN